MTEKGDVREFLLREIPAHSSDIATHAAKHFGISRQAVNKHLRELAEKGLIVAQGRTRGRAYVLAVKTSAKTIALDSTVKEDVLWREWASPSLGPLRDNVRAICQYGFTEIVNNAVDHSEGRTLSLEARRSPVTTILFVHDDGVGIFNKIRQAFGLDDERHAILELAKGKLTTDPTRHTGEGLFFTSRMFDRFSILSGALSFYHSPVEGDWLLERQPQTPTPGTLVVMEIQVDSQRTTREVFDRFTAADGGYGFDITHVPVALAQYGDENLISRSQAKRVLARVDRFKKVILDFADVETIGQAFADEIFRVFTAGHPDTELSYVNAGPDVERMIHRASSAGE